MNGPRRQAFTLAELMVSISIIGLLAAMVMPTFARMYSTARQTVCAGQLDKIGQAYYGCKASEKLDPNAQALTAAGWTGPLLRWAGNDAGLLICPESDPDEVAGGPMRPEDLATLVVWAHGRNRWTGAMEDTYYNLEPLLPAGIANRTMHWETIERTSSSWTTALEDTWQDNPSDKHYKDLVIRFDFMEMAVRATYVSEGTGSFHYHLTYPNGDIILTGMGEGENGKNFGMSADIRSLHKTSYGLNFQADHIPATKHVILALDYEKALADCAGNDAQDPLEWEEWVAPRHMDRCNVLFADGAVKLMWPGAIDPVTPQGLELWGP